MDADASLLASCETRWLGLVFMFPPFPLIDCSSLTCSNEVGPRLLTARSLPSSLLTMATATEMGFKAQIFKKTTQKMLTRRCSVLVWCLRPL